MSEELIFDSERQEMRAARKRWLLPCLVLAGILVLAVAVALIIRAGRSEIHSGGQDTDYPFTWTQKSDGDVELTVPHEDAPDCRWSLKNGEASLPALQITREGSKDGKAGTVFTLHPEAAGRCLFTLVLGGAEENARLYETTFLAEVSETEGRLSVALLNASGVRFQTELSGGDGGENSYRIYSDAQGNLVLTVPVTDQGMDWSYEIPAGEDSLELLGLIYEDGMMRTILRAGETVGASELVLQSEAAAATITLQLESAADGSLRVVSHTADYGEKIPAPETEPMVSTDPDGDQTVSTAPLPISTDHVDVVDFSLEATAAPTEEAPAASEAPVNP